MSERTCTVCTQRHYHRAHVCDPCRTWLHTLLADIRTLWRRLPEALHTTRGNHPKVSGSRNPPAPVNLDAVDLHAPARPGSRAPFVRGLLGDEDQIGHLAAATVLDRIVRDWRDQLWPDSPLPAGEVDSLVRWLSNRLEDACNKHDAMDEVADELKALKTALRATLSDFPARPELCHGVACKQCDLRALYRGEKWITCGNCGLLYSDSEYRDWVKLLAADARGVAA